MSDNLFGDPSAGVPDEHKQRQLRIDTYAELLLSDPPIPGLERGKPGRERLARRLAEKDVARYERMLWRLDLELAPKPARAVMPPAATPLSDPESAKHGVFGDWYDDD